MIDKKQTPAPAGIVYVMGFIGAAVFFFGKATSFWMGVLGFFKAVVWPSLLVYQAFNSLAG